MTCVKKIKFGAKKPFMCFLYIFVHITEKKNQFLVKLQEHTQNVENFTPNLCSNFFDISKCFFRQARAYELMFRNEFPLFPRSFSPVAREEAKRNRLSVWSDPKNYAILYYFLLLYYPYVGSLTLFVIELKVIAKNHQKCKQFSMEKINR